MLQKKNYDLEKRTLSFGIKIIRFSRTLPLGVVMNPLITQVVRSSTSIGANYHEANAAESPRDFFHKIAIARKEAKETVYWLRLLSECNESERDKINQLLDEANQLASILTAIYKKKKQM